MDTAKLMESLGIKNQSPLKIYRESCKVSQKTTDTREGEFLSVYAGVRTKKGISDATAEIVKAFPGWSNEQTDILKDRFAENSFTDERMLDSVNHVIDTFVYGSIPNIAHFIQFDKKVKIYSWNELEKLHNDGNANRDDYGMLMIDGKVRYAKNSEIDRYKITRHVPKTYADTFVPPPVDMSKFEGTSVEQMMATALKK